MSCIDDKIFNRFTGNCVNKNSPSGIFLDTKSGNLPELTKKDMDFFNKLKVEQLQLYCNSNAPKIGCENFINKKDLSEHLLNNINIMTGEVFCKKDKVFYKDLNKCSKKRKVSKCKYDEIENPDTNRCVKRTGKIGQKILDLIKSTSKLTKLSKSSKSSKLRKSPLQKVSKCKDDEIENPDTNRCVKRTGKIGQKILDLIKSTSKITKSPLKNSYKKLNVFEKYSKLLLKTSVKKGLIKNYNYEKIDENLVELLKTAYERCVIKLEKLLDNVNDTIRAEKDLEFLNKKQKEAITMYFNKNVYGIQLNYEYINEYIFVDMSIVNIDKFFKIMEKIIFDMMNDQYFTEYKKSPQFKQKILQNEGESPISKQKKSKYEPRTPELKKYDKYDKYIEKLLRYGLKEKLIGTKYKKNYVYVYLEELLSELYNKLKKEIRKNVSENEKNKIIKKFMKEYVEPKIDKINNDLKIGMSELNSKKSRIWLENFLPFILLNMNYD